MLVVISPAKTLDYETPSPTDVNTLPDYLDHSQQLINRVRNYSTLDIAEIMDVSAALAQLNFDRFEAWHTPFTQQNAKQAVLAFKGDVYTGLRASSFTGSDFEFAQKHLRILSGLYGLLRPLDLMQPYRLEMGRKIENDRGNNLYAFWGDIITEGLNAQLDSVDSDCLINLASNEYFKAVKAKRLNARVVTPQFKDFKNGEYKMMGVYAKKARGLLSRYIVKNKLTRPEDLKAFEDEGYSFNQAMSKGDTWVFARKQ